MTRSEGSTPESSRPFAAELRWERLPSCSDVEWLVGRLAGQPGAVVLESGLDVAGTGQWHILAAHPFGHAIATGTEWETSLHGETRRGSGSAWRAVEAWWEEWARSDDPHASGLPTELPMVGGAIGYFGYELGEQLERIDVARPSMFAADLFAGMPDLHLRLYDELVLVERETGDSYFVHRARPGGEARRWWEASTPRREESPTRFESGSGRSSVSIDDASYLDVVDAIRSLIERGDVYEVNLTRCHRVDAAPSAWELYRRLRRLQPVPYGAYLPWSPVSVISASPERFLRRRGTEVDTRPIKGTAPRIGVVEVDRQAAAELLASEKERAELAMIIDLERNDLGRVCEVGSVEVVEEAALEEYATVFHTVGTVRGTVSADLSPFRLLAATFPGGSITGAPKIAAMETIRRFEPCPRKVYTGSIGWIAPNGDLDLSIAIRTVLQHAGSTLFSVGGAVTWDSVPEAELEELAAKGRAVFRALEGE